jgi:hypothetical protein
MRARAAASKGFLCGYFLHVSLDSFFIVRRGLTFLKRYRPRGASRQAIPEPVAVIIPQEFGLIINQSYSPFVAGIYTQAAAIAFFFVDFNNFPYH